MSRVQKREAYRKRINTILAALFLIAIIIIVRLFLLQIINGEKYYKQAERQYVSITDDNFNRGSIFFTDKDGKEIAAATLKSGYSISVNPQEVENAEEVIKTVAPYSKYSETDIRSKVLNKRRTYEALANRVSTTDEAKLYALHIPGLHFSRQSWRYYPGGSLASHTIGFVGYDKNIQDGRYGLERYYEYVLNRSGSSIYVNIFANLFSGVRDSLLGKPDKQEGDVITTIEPTVQLHLEQVLEKVQEKYHSKFSAGIVIDPKTGKIYALAVAPSFDLNNFRNAQTWQYPNPLVERVYEMGSIMKPLTVAAGLDAGVIKSDSTYNDTGSVVLNGSRISNYDKKARGIVPVQEILSQSLNVGAAHVEHLLGNDTFRAYMKKYGILEETGIDLPNEAQNITNNLNSPRDIEYATASFGQGIALTPMSMARALSVLPDGYIEQPSVASKTITTAGVVHTIDNSDTREQVLKPETVETINRMLTKVYDDALLGGKVKMEHYSIASKTGTAQIASPDGKYYKDKYLHSFFGYFPSYNARFLIFLMTVEPKGELYASHTLTYPFVDMTKFLINYYDIPPDR